MTQLLPDSFRSEAVDWQGEDIPTPIPTPDVQMQTINLPIALDESLAVPLYEQITESLKNAICSGQLAHGSPIDSVRVLSKKLGVSRQTIMHSMKLLESQGYIESRQGRLTTVTVQNRDFEFSSGETFRSKDAPQQKSEPTKSDFGERILALGLPEERAAISSLLLQPYDLPFNHWKRLTIRNLHEQKLLLDNKALDPLGLNALRLELRRYLGRARSVICDADQIVIFPDTMTALDTITRLLVNRQSEVAVENPTLPSNLSALRAHDLNVYPLDVDEEGACVQWLYGLIDKPKMVFVTPSHNSPLGTPMSINRRRSLLTWAEKYEAVIVENDEDSHYRYASRPMPSLQGLDSNQNNVIYLSSFARVLEPLSRLAFVVVPKNLVPLFAAHRQHLQQSTSLLEQLVLTDFLKSGFLERHIRKNVQTLAHIRRSLVIALTRAFRRDIQIANESVGTYLRIQIKTECSDSTVVQAAKLAGLTLEATASFYLLQNPPTGEFVVSFANIDDAEIEARINDFSTRLRDASCSS